MPDLTLDFWRVRRDEWGYTLILVRPGNREFPLLGAHFQTLSEIETLLAEAPILHVRLTVVESNRGVPNGEV